MSILNYEPCHIPPKHTRPIKKTHINQIHGLQVKLALLSATQCQLFSYEVMIDNGFEGVQFQTAFSAPEIQGRYIYIYGLEPRDKSRSCQMILMRNINMQFRKVCEECDGGGGIQSTEALSFTHLGLAWHTLTTGLKSCLYYRCHSRYMRPQVEIPKAILKIS